MGDQFINHWPRLAEVLGQAWVRKIPEWLQTHVTRGPAWLRQLDDDLGVLARTVPVERLIASYSAMIRREPGFLDAVYEIHGAALLGSIATGVDLHVSRGDGSGRNYDIRAVIHGHAIQADSKTRTDDFPMIGPRPSGGWFGIRPVLDPHEAVDLGLPVRRVAPEGAQFSPTPESTVIRQRLLGALAQLPKSGYNVVLFGHISGSRDHLERALGGGEYMDLIRNDVTKEITSEWRRGPGAFREGTSGDPSETVSAVLWMRLLQLPDGAFVRDYLLYPNRRARSPLPPEVLEVLDRTMQAWNTAPKEEHSN